MKSIFTVLCLALMASTQAFAASECDAQLSLAKSELKVAQDQFEVGEVTQTDVAQAKLNLLGLEWSCKVTTLASYCAQAPKLATFVLKGTLEEAASDARTEEEVSAARYQKSVVEMTCR